MKNLGFLCVLITFALFIGSCGDTVSPTPKVNEKEEEFYDLNLGDGYSNYGTILSPDGSMIAISGIRKNQGFAGVYDAKTGTKLFEFPYDIVAFPVNFSDDGSKLLFKSVKDTATVINPRTGEILQKFSNVFKTRLLPDGSAVINRSNYPELKLGMYSVADGKKIKDLSFNDVADWELVGTNGSNRIILFNTYKDQNITLSNVRIVEWDISTDTKVSDITIPNSLYHEIATGHTPDFSVIALHEPYTNSLNFFNTKTGTKINSTPIELATEAQDFGFSNDLTFATRKDDTSSLVFAPLTTSNMKDDKLQKTLTLPSDTTIYKELTYSSNSQYLAGVGINLHKIEIRVWRLK